MEAIKAHSQFHVSKYAKFAFRIYWMNFVNWLKYIFMALFLKSPLNGEKRIWEKGELSLFPHTRC